MVRYHANFTSVFTTAELIAYESYKGAEHTTSQRNAGSLVAATCLGLTHCSADKAL